MPGSNETFYVVDGHAQFFRAYYAIRGGMTSPTTNEATQMAFGFVGMMMRLIRDRAPHSLVLVIDAAGDDETFRSAIYPEYKANRQPAPIDFHGQVERCLEFTRLLGVPVFAVPAVEADDVIATIVRRVQREHPDRAIRIVSRDKDLSQLLDARTTLFDPQNGSDLGPEELFETKGVRAAQVADMLALMGDAVDNVPGVAGIGPKTAAQLITTYGSIDGVLANLAALTPKRREAIEAARETLALSRKLVALKEDCEIDFSYELAKLDLSRAKVPELIALLATLGFGRLRGEVESLLKGETVQAGSGAPVAVPAAPRATSTTAAKRSPSPDRFEDAPLFAGLAALASESAPIATTHAVHLADYRCLRTRQEIEAAVAEATSAARAGVRIAFDTETDSLNTVTARLCGVSLSWRQEQGVYIPVRSPDPASHCSLGEVVAALRPLMEDPTLPKSAHNAKFDLKVLATHGIKVQGLSGDSMVASYVLDATRVSHSLDSLAQACLGYTTVPITDLIGVGDFQRTFDQVPLEQAALYAAEDADIAGRLDRLLTARIEESGLTKLYLEIEMPLVAVLAELETNGILVDRRELDEQCARLSKETDTFREALVASAPHPFNPDSPKQLAAVLFNAPTDDPPGLGLKGGGKKGTTGPSTSVDVLEKLAGDPDVDSDIPARMIEYRRLRKLVGTYLVALREAIEPTTGRIHASFHQTGTATGRLSSSEPNMQNIPIRSERGREIRRAFIAPPGFKLLACDYSQIELRVLAHMADDPAMIAAFEAGDDIHAAVAAQVNGIDPKDVTPAQRNGAKMVNFGIIYGITAFGLSRRLGGGTTPQRAKEIIDSYRARFSKIDAFLAKCVAQARTHGYVETMFGRRRAIAQIASRNPAERALGERVAINTVVQGTAADLIKLAMLEMHRGLGKHCPGTKMLLQIHDELVFEVPEGELAAATAWIRDRMEHVVALRVPLVAQSASGANWYDAK